jgi:hypothetical protein
VELFPDLRISSGAVDDLFQTINASSRYVVASILASTARFPPPAATRWNRLQHDDPARRHHPAAHGAGRRGGRQPGRPERADRAVAGQEHHLDADVQAGLQESFANLVTDPDDDNYLPFVLQTQSRLVRARIDNSLAADQRLPKATDAPVKFHDGASPRRRSTPTRSIG